MKNLKIDKKNYDKFAFKCPLAIESYCDSTQCKDMSKLNEMHMLLKKYHNLQKETIKSRDELVSKLEQIIDYIGIDNFEIYDDGDINYKN